MEKIQRMIDIAKDNGAWEAAVLPTSHLRVYAEVRDICKKIPAVVTAEHGHVLLLWARSMNVLIDADPLAVCSSSRENTILRIPLITRV